MLQRSRLSYIFSIWVLLFLHGCATAPHGAIVPSVPSITGVPGFYHTVAKGQTLWKISKLYGVDVDDLAQINRIQDSGQIEIGQNIFIPGRKNEIKQNLAVSGEDFMWPLRGRIISRFGSTNNHVMNKGIDISSSSISGNVVASRSGRVVFYNDNFLCYGKTIIIDHADGFFTVYGRNQDIFVKLGDNVQKGSTIARVGRAGRDNAVYLYFEIRKGHIAKNPSFYLP